MITDGEIQQLLFKMGQPILFPNSIYVHMLLPETVCVRCDVTRQVLDQDQDTGITWSPVVTDLIMWPSVASYSQCLQLHLILISYSDIIQQMAMCSKCANILVLEKFLLLISFNCWIILFCNALKILTKATFPQSKQFYKVAETWCRIASILYFLILKLIYF